MQKKALRARRAFTSATRSTTSPATHAREAVRAIGAKYVLILDRNEDAMRRWFWCYDESDWGGIEAHPR